MKRRHALALIALGGLLLWIAGAWVSRASKDPPTPAASAVDQVKTLVNERRFEEAENVARRLLAEAERTSGPESMPTADALDALVQVMYHGEKVSDESKRLAERAIRIKEARLGPVHLDLAFSLNSLVQILVASDEFAEARNAALRVVSIREKLLGEQSLALGRGVANVALCEWRLGDFAEARRDYDRALRIFQSVGAPEYPDQCILLNNMAVLLEDLGDYEAARNLLERVVTIGERVQGPMDRELGGGYENLCRLLTKMGDFNAARRACERCLWLWERDPGPDTGEVASALHRLARLHEATGEVAGALPLAEHGVAIRRKLHQIDGVEGARELCLLGEILALNGHFSSARFRLAEGLRSLERIIPADHPDLVEVRRDLATVDWRLGDLPAAWDGALRAVVIGRENLRDSAAGLSEREAIRYESTHQSSIGLLLSLLLFSNPGAAPGNAAGLVLNEVIRSRAIVLDEMASRHRVVSADKREDVERLAKSLDLARNRLSRLLVNGAGATSPASYREQLARAQEDEGLAERSLAARSTDFRRRLSREHVGLPEVASALPRSSVLIAYVRFDRVLNDLKSQPLPFYMAFVQQAGATAPTAIPLGQAAEIDNMVLRWREEVSARPLNPRGDSNRSYSEAGVALRERIWDPVAAQVPSRGVVFVVPDGLLNLVSLAALPVGEGRYLIEAGPLVHYLSAERNVVHDQPARSTASSLLAVGGADFDARPGTGASLPPADGRHSAPLVSYRSPAPACRALQALQFETLGGSLAEIREIESLWAPKGRVVALTGSRAEEGALKRDAPGFGTLHIATHGFFMQESCQSGPEKPGRFDHPLLLSGLAFAGANARRSLPADALDEDGVLTAEEISTLDLSGVDWVVLSACDTGLGRVLSGEGVLGLRRAFEVAGAGTLIMSLWNVEDDATRLWMRGLYEARLSGMGTAEAVRQAGMKMLEEQRRHGRTTHPFYWGGFVAAGDWR